MRKHPNLEQLHELCRARDWTLGLRVAPEVTFLVKDQSVRWRELSALEIYDQGNELVHRVLISSFDELELAAETLCGA